MTATLPEQKMDPVTGRSEPRREVPFGTRESLLRGPPPKTADVVVNGIDGPARYRIRELRQGQVEAISAAGFKQSVADDGKLVRTFDFEGNKARYVAHSLVSEDGRAFFDHPMEEYVLLNQSLTPAMMDVLHKAVLRLNGMDEEAQKEMGKGSGTTASSRA